MKDEAEPKTGCGVKEENDPELYVYSGRYGLSYRLNWKENVRVSQTEEK